MGNKLVLVIVEANGKEISPIKTVFSILLTDRLEPTLRFQIMAHSSEDNLIFPKEFLKTSCHFQ